MENITILLLVLFGIAVLVSAIFLIIKLTSKPKMTELDHYYKHYNSRLIYGDGSGSKVTARAAVIGFEQKVLYGQDVNYVCFELPEGKTVSLAIRGKDNASLFSEGDKGELVFKGNTFVSFTLDGETEPLLICERYAEQR